VGAVRHQDAYGVAGLDSEAPQAPRHTGRLLVQLGAAHALVGEGDRDLVRGAPRGAQQQLAEGAEADRRLAHADLPASSPSRKACRAVRGATASPATSSRAPAASTSGVSETSARPWTPPTTASNARRITSRV